MPRHSASIDGSPKAGPQTCSSRTISAGRAGDLGVRDSVQESKMRIHVDDAQDSLSKLW